MQVEVDSRNVGEQKGSDESCKDAELCGCSQKQGLGVGNERAEVRHGSYAHEDQNREETALDTGIEEDLDESHGALCTCCKRGIASGDVGERDVGKHAAHSDGDEQQGLESLLDGQIEEQESHEDHDEVAPAETGSRSSAQSQESVETCGLPQFNEILSHCSLLRRLSEACRLRRPGHPARRRSW